MSSTLLWSRVYAITMGFSSLLLMGMGEFLLAAFALGHFLYALVAGLHEALEKL